MDKEIEIKKLNSDLKQDNEIEKDIEILCLFKNLSINDKNNNDKLDDFNEISKNDIVPNIKIKIFDKKKYFKKMELIILNILKRPQKNTLSFDILDTEKSIHIKLLSLKEKQRQMKIGEIWQVVLGNYDGFVNLKNGHESGLDILSYEKKIAIELKNRTNTDNSSSKKSNFDKISNFKKKNPEYTCIYANINSSTKEKTLKGMIKNITHNGVEIQHHIGYSFLKFILGDDVEIVINFVKNQLNQYIENINDKKI